MATKGTNAGLISKVARFVRNPTVDWSQLDSPVAVPDAGYSKQALKEMIERKRRNDFVRRREFDQLRKLRSRGPVGAGPDQPDRPSFFQTSTASLPEDRASTLKKIDDIEAQMSKQWWKGHPDGTTVRSDSVPSMSEVTVPAKLDATQTETPSVQSSGFAVTHASGLQLNSEAVSSFDFEATRLSSPSAPIMGSMLSAPQIFSTELSDGITDPELEEAAIRFANGDDAGAEVGLLEALQNNQLHQDSATVWTATLFDFYRATGQQARFDVAAIDFAQRFGRSAPAWFSMPELLGRQPGSVAENTAPVDLAGEPVWESPAKLGLDDVDRLIMAVANAPTPWCLDWSQLASIEASAVVPLGQLLAHWCGAPVRLQFRGAENLEKTLQRHTPSGDRQISPAWWQLRMDALRIMGLQDEFELAALEYCVTYEVSPPAWADTRCNYIGEQTNESGDIASGGRRSDAEVPDRRAGGRDHAVTMPLDLDPAASAAIVELSGEILGDLADALAKLDIAMQDRDRLVISCAKLIRVDFSAAGSLLNWVAERQAEGRHVQFREVHRLVGAFFNVIGIHEHAGVVLRTN
jgi:ABC-type transporter Mla MlaB component